MVSAFQPETLYDELIDFLLSAPTPEQIIALRPSDAMQERLRYLLDASRSGHLNDAERTELDLYGQLEHLIRRLKLRVRNRQHSC